MNKINFLVFACLLSFLVSCSQQKRYVTYKVKQGETMRDIANRMDMRTKDLLKLNPDVGRKPNANTTIIIPNPNIEKGNVKNIALDTNVTPEVNEVNDPITIDSVVNSEAIEVSNAIVSDTTKVVSISYEYIKHTVLPKETVYALTKKYNLSKEELLKLNPEFPNLKNNELSIGQVLNVKGKEVKTLISLEDDLKNYVTHTVKPKETVYKLTKFYNISKDELVNLNTEYPEIKDNSLQIGQVLRIRLIESKSDADDITMYVDSIGENVSLKLAFLLPFNAKKYDSINTKDIFKNNKLINMVTDFYMGAEIAIDSIKQQGVQLDVQVYDSGSKGGNVTTILEEGKLNDVDVVIGPFYSSKVEIVASKVKAPVVFPHYSKKQVEFSSNKLVKIAPDLEVHTSFLSSYLKGIYNGETIFVVGDNGQDSNIQIGSLVTNLKKHDSINKVIVLKTEDGYIKKERFTDQMNPNAHCWVIMTSNDKVAVADALNSMIVLPEDVTAQVFSIKKNKAYNDIDNNKLARVGFTYVTNAYTDVSSLDTKVFNKKYNNNNFALPSEYSIKGFDVTYDVLMRLSSGQKLSNTFDNGMSFRLETKFDYRNKPFGTTNNEGLFIVKYNSDLTLKRLK